MVTAINGAAFMAGDSSTITGGTITVQANGQGDLRANDKLQRQDELHLYGDLGRGHLEDGDGQYYDQCRCRAGEHGAWNPDNAGKTRRRPLLE